MKLQTKKIIAREGLLVTMVVIVGYWLSYFVVYFLLGRTDLIINKVSYTIMPSSGYNQFDFSLSLLISLPSYVLIRFILWAIRTLSDRYLNSIKK